MISDSLSRHNVLKHIVPLVTVFHDYEVVLTMQMHNSSDSRPYTCRQITHSANFVVQDVLRQIVRLFDALYLILSLV